MKKFIQYLLYVVIGFSFLDICNRLLCKEMFLNPNSNSIIRESYKFAFIDDSCELAVIGASRAMHHYNAQLIEDSIGIKTYNWGYDGESIIHQYLCLLKAIQNSKLKLVILDLSPHQLSKEWIEGRISKLYPYYWENDSVRSIVKDVKGDKMDILLESSFIQYNSKYHVLFTHSNNILEKKRKGFVPLPKTGKPVIRKENEMSIDWDSYSSPLATKYLRRIIKMSKKYGVKLVVCISPSLSLKMEDVEYMKNLITIYNIECWDMSRSIQDGNMFADLTHLNSIGADIFTQKMISNLKSHKN